MTIEESATLKAGVVGKLNEISDLSVAEPVGEITDSTTQLEAKGSSE